MRPRTIIMELGGSVLVPTLTSPLVAPAIKAATSIVTIVFSVGVDPIELGKGQPS